MKKINALLALFAAFAAPASFAAGLPVCFQMSNDPLNRFYAVVSNPAQSPVQSSAESLAVTAFEYHVASYQPAERRLSLQVVMTGTASFSPTGELSGVNVGTTHGDGSPVATYIMNDTFTGWTLTRYTGVGTPTHHQVEPVPCVVPGA